VLFGIALYFLRTPCDSLMHISEFLGIGLNKARDGFVKADI